MYIEKDNSHIVDSGLHMQAYYTRGHERFVCIIRWRPVIITIQERVCLPSLYMFAFNLRSFQNGQISLSYILAPLVSRENSSIANFKR